MWHVHVVHVHVHMNRTRPVIGSRSLSLRSSDESLNEGDRAVLCRVRLAHPGAQLGRGAPKLRAVGHAGKGAVEVLRRGAQLVELHADTEGDDPLCPEVLVRVERHHHQRAGRGECFADRVAAAVRDEELDLGVGGRMDGWVGVLG